MNETIKELRRDLAHKLERHGPQLEQLWRLLGQEQRKKVMKEGAYQGIVLEHPRDTSMGNVYQLIPDWNLRDITSPSSDLLLGMLRHRATASLQDQYSVGVNGSLGDHALIMDMIQKENLQHINASELEDCYTLFKDEEEYGRSIRIMTPKKDEVLAGLMPGIRAQLIVPQAIGDLILMRQNYLLQSLNIIVEDILDSTSTTRSEMKRKRKPADTMTAAFAGLSLHAPPKMLGLSALIDSALDQKSSLEEFLNLMSTEPFVLAHQVNLSFFARPELVADEKGRSLPMHTDKYISGAVFDAVHDTVKTAAIWNYITRLLNLLEGSTDKQFRDLVLKELSSICHLEYTRAQTAFKRHVSTGSGGNKWFKRISTIRKDGIIRISLKRNPESLTVENPQLHYMLRLCQDETNWPGSTHWLQKIQDLHRAHPLEKEKIVEREFDALGDLAVIVAFIQSLSSVVPLPSINHRQGQLFISKFSALGSELEQLKTVIDLGDFCIPIANLRKPEMAVGALTTLNKFLLENTGLEVLAHQRYPKEGAVRI